MSTLYIAIVVVVLLVVGAIFVVQVQSRRNRGEASGGTASASTLKRRWFWQRDRTSKRLRKWLHDNLEDEAVKSWLQTLPDEDVERLINEISAFSDQAEINLHWLLDGEMNRDEQLLNTIKSVISLHIRSRYEAALVADDIATFAAYYRLANEPSNKDTDLVKALYAKLVEEGLVPNTPPELSMASTKEGRKYAMEQIQMAAEKDWSAFSTVLKDVLNLESAAAIKASGEKPRRRRQKVDVDATNTDTPDVAGGVAPAPSSA